MVPGDSPLLTRRRLIAASGAAVAAPLALAACGNSVETERSEDNDIDLLNGILAAQLTVLELARAAAGNLSPAADVVATLARERKTSTEALAIAVEGSGGTATTEAVEAPAAESPAEALIVALQSSIETGLEAIGSVSKERLRQVAHRDITLDAAALSGLRSATGGDIAPDSFVFGPPAEQEGNS